MYAYPYTLEPDDGTVLLQFVDVPIAHTFGETEDSAVSHALDALETAMIAIMATKGEIPRPSPARGRPTVSLPPLDAAKVELYRTLRRLKIGKAELGRRLGWHAPQVDRLLDLRHASKLDQLEQAFAALGKEIEFRVKDKPKAA
jgi:antitoxin HicB